VIFVLSITVIVALSALLLSVFSVFHAQALARTSQQRNAELRSRQDARLDAVRKTIDGLLTEVRELQAQPSARPGPMKPGLNLSKRSQALRMHRKGETAEQIASALEIPPQEVELLIKVQRIVLSNV